MRDFALALAIVILAGTLAAAPVAGGSVRTDTCAEIRIETLTAGKHPTLLRTAYFVVDGIKADSFEILYRLGRAGWEPGDPELNEKDILELRGAIEDWRRPLGE